jgi:predicted  nucleic acid-binding Zn-ribbon protein
VGNKLQRTTAQLNTINNDLQRHRQDVTNYDNQKRDLDTNITNQRTAIERHERSMQDHRTLLSENQTAIGKINDQYQKQTRTVDEIKQKTASEF